MISRINKQRKRKSKTWPSEWPVLKRWVRHVIADKNALEMAQEQRKTGELPRYREIILTHQRPS